MDDHLVPAPDLRVSTAEREHVTELLTRHLGAGRLSPDEYAERASSASTALTRKELNVLLVDLPGALLPDSLARDVLELRNVAGDHTRRGEWVVPSRIVVSSRMGNVGLDLRRARFTVPVVTVEADIGVGNIDIRLPENGTVDLDDARTRIGQIIDRTTRRAEPGTPHVVLRGGTWLGNIYAR